MYIANDKKCYEIAKALEAAENIRMDLYYRVRYEKKAEQDIIIIDRGGGNYSTSTKWKLYIEDNGIEVEKKWTFDQYFFFVAMVIEVFTAVLIFTMLAAILIISLMKGDTPDISTASFLLEAGLGLFGIFFVVWYKHIFYDRPREILLEYFEKYIICDVNEKS